MTQTQRSFLPTADDAALARIAQMLLRVAGVFLAIEGAGGVVGSVSYISLQAIGYRRGEFLNQWDPHPFAWFISSGLTCLGGLYLIIGGRWVLEKVFLPSQHAMRHEEPIDVEE